MKSINTFNPGPQTSGMRNAFMAMLRNRFSLLAFTILMGYGIVSAQTVVTTSSSTGNSSDFSGVGSGDDYGVTANLYLASELSSTWGYISSVGWYYDYNSSSPFGSYTASGIKIWLNNTASTTLTNGTAYSTYTSAPYTSVYNSSYTLPGSNAFNGANLSTAYLLNSGSNLTVVSQQGVDGDADLFFYCAGSTSTTSYEWDNTSAPVAGSTLSTKWYKPDLQVTFAKPGITTQPATTASFCASTGSTTLNIASTNTTSYQWQYSPNNSTWSNIVAGTPAGSAYTPSATAPALAATGSLAISGISVSGTYYYRCIAANGNGASSTTTSGTCTLTVNTATAAPTTQATGLTFSSVTSGGMTINWTNGNGAGRSVFMFAGSTGNPAPVSGTAYTGNVAFQSGNQIGATGWYCIYSGTGTGPITISNLTPTTTYNIQVCEYNTGTCGSPAYNTTNATNNPLTKATIAACTAPTSVALSGYTTPVCPGNSPGTFTATPSGGSPTSYTYLWFLDGASTGITTQTYAPGNLAVTATVYCAVSTGTTCTTNSTTQTITVNTPNVTNTAPGTVTSTGATINGTD